MFPVSLLAYFDPGAGSLLLQALIGGGAGLLVFFRCMLERYRGSIVPRRRG